MVDGNVVVIFRGDIFVSPFYSSPPIPYSWYWTGILLMRRGRYVAMHAMQDDSTHTTYEQNGYADGGNSQRGKPKPQMRDTFAAVGGMLIPLLTQFGHHH